MELTRLDNRRTVSTEEAGTTAPLLVVNKSYARFTSGALVSLAITPGVSFVGFGQDPASGKFVIYKAPDEKSGKKVSVDSTIVSQSIYKRLNEGSTYELEAVPENPGYFYLTEQVETIAEQVTMLPNNGVDYAGQEETPDSDVFGPTPEADKVVMPTGNTTFGSEEDEQRFL